VWSSGATAAAAAIATPRTCRAMRRQCPSPAALHCGLRVCIHTRAPVSQTQWLQCFALHGARHRSPLQSHASGARSQRQHTGTHDPAHTHTHTHTHTRARLRAAG
jgi:hypothetical protein